MIAALRAEFRKLFTVRATYIICGFILLLVLFYAGYATGYRVDKASLLNSGYLSGQITGAVQAVAVLVALMGLLQFGNEYRWSTIIYSFTSSNSRTKILVAKTIVITIFALVATVLVAVLSPLVTIAGMNLHHYHLVTQSIPYGSIWWTCLFFGWGYSMLALVIVALIRNQIGAIVAFLLIPTTVENLLALLLKNDSRYLPFTSLRAVINPNQVNGSNNIHTAALTALIYIVGGWLVAWVLFLRRDAN